MTLNWNSSLDTTDDLLSSLLSDSSPSVGQQSSVSPPAYSFQSTTVAPTQSNPRTLDFSNSADFGLDPTLQQTNAYFDNSLFANDNYFLSDLEVLGPLDQSVGRSTSSDSSPEPNSVVDSHGHTIFTTPNGCSRSSLAMVPRAGSSASPAEVSLPLSNSRTSSFSADRSISTSSDNRVEDFLDNLNYLKSPMPTTTANGAPLDTVPEEIDLTSDSAKRQRGVGADFLTACWTSPLCPNNKKEGTPPDPATCGGACAPYLFGEQPLPDTIDTALLPQDPPDVRETIESIPERSRPNLKRSETDSSGAAGRTLPSSADASPRSNLVKSERTPSPESQGPEADDGRAAKGRKRLPHNQVERKYRESLNTQLESLRRVVPALQQNRQPLCDSADIEDLPAPSKPSKAVVLASATAYIKQIEKDKKQLVDENAGLRTRIKALQSLVKYDVPMFSIEQSTNGTQQVRRLLSDAICYGHEASQPSWSVNASGSLALPGVRNY